MRMLQVILSAVTTLLTAFTLICGIWLRNAGSAADAGSPSLHMGLAVASGVFVLATAIVTLIRTSAVKS